MTNEEIIKEGYLEAYLTEDLSDPEMQEVEEAIASNPDVKRAFFALSKSIEGLAFHYGIKPPETVRRALLATLQGGHRKRGFVERSMAIAASLTIALVSTVCAIYFWNQWKATDRRLSELVAQNIQLAENYNTVNNELGEVKENLSVLISPYYSRIILAGTDNAPDASAVVYWSARDEKVFLNSATLAQLSTDQQYQLWALIGGVPVSAGVFDARSGTFQIMSDVVQADAFAVTIEPKGGSEAPTLETMQVYGSTS